MIHDSDASYRSDEFRKWIEGYGIEHRQAGGDPAELMKLSIEHKILSPGFFKESLGHFKKWLDDRERHVVNA